MATPTIAIMQPYFLPYAGYFRLFAGSDLFVIYDCVQFPRRGWVHRNRLIDTSGIERWLTLPLQRASQTVLIRDLRFPPEVKETFLTRLRSFPLIAQDLRAAEPLLEVLRDIGGRPIDYLDRLLERTVAHLGLPWKTIRSSTLDIPASFRGQDRILEIATRLGARRYLNVPGGRSLYDPAAFEDAGIELAFLPDYRGPKSSILTRILRENVDDITEEIYHELDSPSLP